MTDMRLNAIINISYEKQLTYPPVISQNVVQIIMNLKRNLTVGRSRHTYIGALRKVEQNLTCRKVGTNQYNIIICKCKNSKDGLTKPPRRMGKAHLYNIVTENYNSSNEG